MITIKQSEVNSVEIIFNYQSLIETDHSGLVLPIMGRTKTSTSGVGLFKRFTEDQTKSDYVIWDFYISGVDNQLHFENGRYCTPGMDYSDAINHYLDEVGL